MTIGTKYKNKKGKTFTVKKVAVTDRFTYITVLLDELEDTKDNRRVFGREAFLGEFNLIKEVENGSS